MNALIDDLVRNWPSMVAPAIIFAVVLLAGWFARRILFNTLEHWTARSTAKVDDVVVGALRGPSLLWILMLALHIAMQSSELPVRITSLVSKTLLILWILSLTVVAARLAGSLVKLYGGGHHGAGADPILPVTTLTQSIASLVVGTIGILILLNTFGISVTPILTALGVGGLAVALALQDTLSNLFAGFYISIAGQIRIGDYIKLDTGEEGYVADISWRSTAIRSLSNNLIVVPNSKIAQAIVTNYHLPEKRMSLLIPIGVSYDCDPDEVERILIEEAKEGAKVIPGLLEEPPPFVRFMPGFGDSSINFTLICQVAEFTDQYLSQHELRKRIFKRFRREGIVIPFPIRTVYMKSQIEPVPTAGPTE